LRNFRNFKHSIQGVYYEISDEELDGISNGEWIELGENISVTNDEVSFTSDNTDDDLIVQDE